MLLCAACVPYRTAVCVCVMQHAHMPVVLLVLCVLVRRKRKKTRINRVDVFFVFLPDRFYPSRGGVDRGGGGSAVRAWEYRGQDVPSVRERVEWEGGYGVFGNGNKEGGKYKVMGGRSKGGRVWGSGERGSGGRI